MSQHLQWLNHHEPQASGERIVVRNVWNDEVHIAWERTDEAPQTKTFALNGEEIPTFAAKAQGDWKPFVFGNTGDLLRKHPIFEEAELVLIGYAEATGGVGQSLAVPMVLIGDNRFRAADLSRGIKPNASYVRAGDGWLPVKLLKRIGIGPMGRTTNGAPLDKPYQLTPFETLRRGGDRLQGPWKRVLFPDLDWPYGGEKPVADHLRFLAAWGICGGVKGGLDRHAAELLDFLESTLRDCPECRILVVGKKYALQRLIEKGQAGETKATGMEEQLTFELDDAFLGRNAAGKLQGVAAATPHELALRPELRSAGVDILVMLEPDDLTKSTSTQAYRNLNGIKARLRLAVYSKAGYIDKPAVKATHMRLLKLHEPPARRYAIYDPDKPVKKLPPPYRATEWNSGASSSAYPKETKFAEFDTGFGTASGVRIPPRPAAGGSSAARTAPEPAGYANYSNGGQSFVRQAKELVHAVGPEVPFVPFMSYWPTYGAMTNAQKKWYLYWRGEVRRQRYPETDLSYIFLYVYELINGIGWEDPMQGCKALRNVWEAYRRRYLKLDVYVAVWLADFILAHRLDVPIYDILRLTPRGLAGELLDLELQGRFAAEPLDLPFELALQLSDYDVRRSKFYIETGRTLIETYVPKVFALVDSYLRKRHGMRMIELFHPGPQRIVARTLFHSAVYDVSLFGRTFPIAAPPISDHEPLRDFTSQLIRLTENKLRELLGFKGRLRGIAIEPEIELLVSRYLERELNRGAEPESAAAAVQIDAAKLAQLQQDSETVRQLLTVETEEETRGTEQAAGKEKEQAEGERLRTASPATVKVVSAVSEASDDSGPLAEAEAEHAGGVVWDTSELGEEWKELSAMLTPAQREALYALKSGLGEREVAAAAEREGTMAELLLDEINAAAMETIGDLLIDGGMIVEEYLPMLANLTR